MVKSLLTIKKAPCDNRKVKALNRLIDGYYQRGIDIASVKLYRHEKENKYLRNALQVLSCYHFIDKKINAGAI